MKTKKPKQEDNRRSVLVKLPPADWRALERYIKTHGGPGKYPGNKQEILQEALRLWLATREAVEKAEG